MIVRQLELELPIDWLGFWRRLSPAFSNQILIRFRFTLGIELEAHMLVLSAVWPSWIQGASDLHVVFRLIEHLIDHPDDEQHDSSISTSLGLVELGHYRLQFVLEFERQLDIQSVAIAYSPNWT